nr:glycosyltransferase family 2 protein [uncultured Flavobacterium sp.]
MNGLVSIIVPCYNQSQYLDGALQSVLDQTYTNWECIIVNDGSPDHTEEIAKRWVKSDLRFVYLKKDNGGLSSARNSGLDIAKGDYLQFLDSDDILDRRKLELSINELYLDVSANVVISNFRMFTVNPNLSSAPYCELKKELFTFKNVLFKWDSLFTIPIHCGLFKSSLFNDFRFPEELKAKEDWIMWLHLFLKEPKVSFHNKSLAYYRTHKDSMRKDDKFMEENYIKAIVYLRNFVQEKDYLDYLINVLQHKFSETIQLKISISNYKKSRSYKVIDKIKCVYSLKRFFIKQ